MSDFCEVCNGSGWANGGCVDLCYRCDGHGIDHCDTAIIGEIARLKEENESLRADKERLDWLDGRYTHVTDGHTYHCPEGELVAYRWSVEDACGTVREAIDFGMNRSPENPSL